MVSLLLTFPRKGDAGQVAELAGNLFAICELGKAECRPLIAAFSSNPGVSPRYSVCISPSSMGRGLLPCSFLSFYVSDFSIK